MPPTATIRTRHTMLYVAQLTLALHVMAMMIASAGPAIALLLDLAGRRHGHPPTRQAGRTVAWHALLLLTAGILVGLLAAILLQSATSREYGPALVTLKRRILWGTAEILFSYVLLLTYATCWRWNDHRSLGVRTLHRSLAILSTLNLLYHFPPLMIVLSEMVASGAPYPATLDAASFRQLAWQPAVALASLHFSVGSFTLAGTWIMAVSATRRCSVTGPSAGNLTMTVSARVALVATGLQFPLGLWLMTRLPPSAQRAYLGGQWADTFFMGAAIVLALWLFHQLASIAFGDHSKRSAQLALIVNATVVTLMVLAAQ